MRRLLSNGVACIVTVALLTTTAAGTATAYFTTTGAGDSAPTGISQLAKPVIATATPDAGGTVALSWGAVTAPGPGAITYSVSRNNSAANGTCKTTLLVVSCTDSGLEPGTYTYVVTAKWRSWTASSSGKAATIAVGPADHFTLSASSLTPTAGTADNLTITAKDAKGNTVTSYAGSHDIAFSGATASPNGTAPTVVDSAGTATAFGSATALTFTAGVASVSSSKNGVMKLYSKGEADVEASDGSITTTAPLEVTVAAATVATFALTAASTTLTAGEADNLTITAQDAYGNLATSYTGSHNLTFSGAATIGINKPTVASSSGTATAFGSATAIAFTAGVATVAASKNGLMKIYASGEADIEVTGGAISTATSLKVSVTSTAAAKFVLSATTTTPTAGETDNLTATAQDTYGNVATSYTGSHSLTFSGASASPGGTVPTVADYAGAGTAFGSATAIDFAAGVANVTGAKNGAMKLYKSGSTSLKVSDGSLTSATTTVTVVATPAAELSLAAASATPAPAAADNLTVTAFDAYGNVATEYGGAHELTFSGASPSPSGSAPTVASSAGTATPFGSPTAIGFTAGVAKVASSKNGTMKLYRAEAANIVVSDGAVADKEGVAVTVSPAAAAKLALTQVSASAGVIGSPCLFTCAVTALGNNGTVKANVAVTDTYGNTVNALGKGHAVKVTSTGGTIAGTPLAIPTAGPAESATQFTYTSKSSGGFTDTITAATSEGTTYTSATATASR
jgi:hypothetical protein